MAAFLERKSSEAPSSPERRGPVAGKMVSFFRSVRGYFLPTAAGQNALAGAQARKAADSKNGLLAPDKVLPPHPTMDYQGEPFVRKPGGEGVGGG